jgi:hypothetical protein
VAGELLENGTARFLGVHAVFRARGSGYETVWQASEEAPVMSVIAEDAAARIADGVVRNAGAALAAWASRLRLRDA